MAADEFAKYVIKHQVSGIFRYYRRVPIEVSAIEGRTHIKQSLKTKSLKEALDRAEDVHKAVEALWGALLHGEDKTSSVARYEASLKAAQSLGFTYKPAADIAALDLDEFEERVAIAEEALDTSPTIVDAMMGTAEDPAPRLGDVWKLYEEHNASGLTGMSKNQLRKHRVSRERAISYAKDELGDLELGKIVRADTLRYRRWWTNKVQEEGLTAYSANRSFSDMAGMLAIIDDALQSDYKAAWQDLRITETNANKLKKRAAFSVEWLATRILAEGALDKLNFDARCILYMMIETGMRLSEVCNLRPEDIRIEAEVPHVEVAERDDRRQKTEYSIRRVPLVGVSLWAAQQFPTGFVRYQDKEDAASAIINKVMKSAGLRPTTRHTAYSIRHTFQDRIENADVSDRMQADLMGHEFGRPVYGDGSEMKRRQETLERIKLPCAWID